MTRTKSLLFLFACLLILAACGQRGPLYLPETAEPAPAPESAVPESAEPAEETDDETA
jgi:predicted small lipoprotein YifL